MELDKILTDLKAERELLDEAIIALERVQRTSRRRGRPASWMKEITAAARSAVAARRGRPRKTQPLAS